MRDTTRDAQHLQHVHVSYPRKGTLEQPSMPGGWRRDGSDGYGRITGAGRRLTSWLRALGRGLPCSASSRPRRHRTGRTIAPAWRSAGPAGTWWRDPAEQIGASC